MSTYLQRWLPSPKLQSNIAWFCLSAIVGLLGGRASPAYPWDSKGHEIVAAIAETQLNDAARKRIKELLPQGTTLADALTWPEQSWPPDSDMDAYHFINFPKDANTYDQRRDCKLRNCVIEAIAWYVQVLKLPDAPRNEKQTAPRSNRIDTRKYSVRDLPHRYVRLP